MSTVNPPPYSLPLTADLFSADGCFVGYVEGYALASESSPELHAVARNDLAVLDGRSADPLDIIHYNALTAAANTQDNLMELALRWDDWKQSMTGEGARADHEYERRQA